MEQGLDSDSAPTPGHIDKSRVLDIRPLRSLVPIFPTSNPQTSSFTGPFPPGPAPVHRYGASNKARLYGFNNPIPSPVPLNSFRTPMPKATSQSLGAGNGEVGPSRRRSRYRTGGSLSQQEDLFEGEGGNSDMHVIDVDGTISGAGTKRPRKRIRNDRQVRMPKPNVDLDSILAGLLTSFNLTGLDAFKQADGDKELVQYIFLVFDVLRKKIGQVEETKKSLRGVTRRPDLKAGALLMTKGIRTNSKKRIGAVPGVEVGDIFFFRIEMCLLGLHSQTMAGIDYIHGKLSMGEEPVAVSIVSSGGYEDDEGEDGNVLVYSGQGGVLWRDKRMLDQKLEGGNLALEKSLHHANEVRVIRGLKDNTTMGGKIYVYDGLYTIQESWVEKGKSDCNVFKYKFVRIPGQPEAFNTWKLILKWKDGNTLRNGVILPDLTSGAESLPVSLVNNIDDGKGPAHFTYIPGLKYSKPFAAPKPSLSCNCLGGCQPGDSKCPCIQKNGGYLAHTSLGVLLSYNSLINECSSSCTCPPNCRNRISQASFKVRLEVFKTKDKGWGLRSLDPIRGGTFICEYAGEVVDSSMVEKLGSDHEDDYIFDSTRIYEPLVPVHGDSNERAKVPFPLVISAKSNGNVARFMNHSCSPNVFWQPVLRENNMDSYLHVAFYAIRHIPPMQELTYDYGLVQSDGEDQRRNHCLCGSIKCRGYFY